MAASLSNRQSTPHGFRSPWGKCRIVTGYRADDSYFDYAEAFVNNALSVSQLAQAMTLGKLGEQVVIKSKFAFFELKYQGFDMAEKDRYTAAPCPHEE